MKKLIILVGLLLVVCGVGYAALLFKAKNQDSVPQDQNVNVETSKSTTYSATINEDTYQQVKYQDPVSLSQTPPDAYGNTIFIEESGWYSIEYFSADSTFNVTLLNKNLMEARAMAQTKIMEKLQVSKEDVCKMKIYVGVPFSYNEELAGQNLGLSFCPGGADLSSYQNK